MTISRSGVLSWTGRVAAGLLLLTVAACGGSSDDTSAAPTTPPPSSAPAGVSIEPTFGSLIPVVRVNEYVVTRNGDAVSCTEHFDTYKLRLGGEVALYRTNISTKVKSNGVLLHANNEVSAVSAILVNGQEVAILPPNAFIGSDSGDLYFFTKDWGVVKTLTLCVGKQ